MERIDPKDINIEDRTFCISYPLEDGILLDSIVAVGIIQPVILRAGQRPTIISGFRRVHGALRLGFKTIPCLFREVTGKEAICLAIHDNLTRNLNLVEKAHIVERMAAFVFDDRETREIMQHLGLRNHEKVRLVLRSLAGAGKEIKDFVVLRNPSLKSLRYLVRFEPDDLPPLLDILMKVRATESQFRQILELMLLLQIRGTPVGAARLAHAETADEIGEILKQETHPYLAEKERRLAALRQRCALPPNMDIRMDPFFEKEYIDIMVRARRPDDVMEALDKLRTIAEQGHIRSLLDLTKD